MSPTDYWANFFGLTNEQFEEPGLKIVEHAELGEYNGAWIFEFNKSIVISVPPQLKQEVSDRLKSFPIQAVTLTKNFAAQLFPELERVIGPCFQGQYMGRLELIERVDESVSLIGVAEQRHLTALRERVDSESWDDSAMDLEKTTFGCFVNDQIVAAACLDMWTDNVANIGLITDPLFRGKGYGKRVCKAAATFGYERGYLMLYQTLLSNAAAVAVGEAVGYQNYATHLAVRFK